jgi:hypothetical protein
LSMKRFRPFSKRPNKSRLTLLCSSLPDRFVRSPWG